MRAELTLSQKNLPVSEEAEAIFLLRLLSEIQAKTAEYPVDMRHVLDRSGSMDDPAVKITDPKSGKVTVISKLEALKGAIKGSLDILRKGKDRICIVVFDDGMDVLVDPQIVNDVPGLKKLVGQIRSGDSTHLSGPLRYALEVDLLKDALTRVVIFTDGIVNSPSQASEERECLSLARQAKKAGIPLAVFGTGVDYNEKFLKQLAEVAGSGSYFKHVSQTGEVRLELEEELENMRSVQARDVKVAIEAANAVIFMEATKYVPQQVAIKTNGNMIEDAFQGLDARGQSYLVRAGVKSQKASGNFLIGNATITWRDATGQQTIKLPIDVNFTNDPNLISPVDKTVMKTVINTEAVKATLGGFYKRAETLFEKSGNTAMAEQVKTLVNDDEDAKRKLRTQTVTKAHEDTLVKDKKGGKS